MVSTVRGFSSTDFQDITFFVAEKATLQLDAPASSLAIGEGF